MECAARMPRATVCYSAMAITVPCRRTGVHRENLAGAAEAALTITRKVESITAEILVLSFFHPHHLPSTYIPYFLGFCCLQLSGEAYQYGVIPRGIAACNRDFTFYQKKLMEQNPGKPQQITSNVKSNCPFSIFFFLV